MNQLLFTTHFLTLPVLPAFPAAGNLLLLLLIVVLALLIGLLFITGYLVLHLRQQALSLTPRPAMDGQA
jgi:hypothetical protein